MADIAKFSAAKLVQVFNAVTAGAPVKKFESQPKALARTLVEIEKAGLTIEKALNRVALMTPPAIAAELPPVTVLNLVNGATLPRLTALHSPLRQVDGDPEKAARKAVKAKLAPPAPVAPTAAEAADKPVIARAGWKRTNKTVPLMLAALRRPEGATLAELTTVSTWEASVELRHLRKMEAKRGFKLAHDGAEGAARRYYAA